MKKLLKNKRIFFTVVSVCMSVGVSRLYAEPTEYDVKAAYLYNFPKFVEWPTPPAEPFCIAVLGDDPFGAGLETMLTGKMIGEHHLTVRHVRNSTEATLCPVVFISMSRESEIQRILNSLSKAPTLTVSDIPGFVQKGGILGFQTVQNTVRFNVNLDAASAARLKISSQLLKVAHAIHGKVELPGP